MSRREPPNRYPSTTKSTVGSICANRSATPEGPKSVLTTDHSAPTLAVASSATTVSGMFGSTPATRSPRPTPSSLSRCARAATRDSSSRQVQETGAPSSCSPTIATSSGRDSAQRSVFSA